jgi:hypothetical protein
MFEECGWRMLMGEGIFFEGVVIITSRWGAPNNNSRPVASKDVVAESLPDCKMVRTCSCDGPPRDDLFPKAPGHCAKVVGAAGDVGLHLTSKCR